MTKKIFPLSRRNEIVVQELKGETLIYDLQTNQSFCLNKTSALVWQLCDGEKSIAEIRQLLAQELNTQITEEFIWLALSQLKKENLLDDRVQFEIDFQGLSRREVIRKIGLASMVMLPVIFSLVAPAAVSAQSGAGPAGLCQACTPAGGCTTGTCKPDYNDPSRAYCGTNPFPATFAGGENAGCGGSEDACLNTLAPGYCCSGSATYSSATTCCTCSPS